MTTACQRSPADPPPPREEEWANGLEGKKKKKKLAPPNQRHLLLFLAAPSSTQGEWSVRQSNLQVERQTSSLPAALSLSLSLPLSCLCSLYLLRSRSSYSSCLSRSPSCVWVLRRCSIHPFSASPSLSPPPMHPFTTHECLDTAIVAERLPINPRDSEYTLRSTHFSPSFSLALTLAVTPLTVCVTRLNATINSSSEGVRVY